MSTHSSNFVHFRKDLSDHSETTKYRGCHPHQKFKEKNLVWGQISNLGSFGVKFKISLEMGKARSSRNLGQPTTLSEVRGLKNLGQPTTSSYARDLRDGRLSKVDQDFLRAKRDAKEILVN